MKRIAVCAVAKYENAYINEWVEYHIKLGIDTIYLYDNNDSDTPYVGDFIGEQYRDKVVIIDRRDENLRTKQQVVYNDWLRNYQDGWDFCAFIDIDEFIVTPDIQQLINNMPDDCDFMVLNWWMYGDDDVMVGDETKPVRERFVNRKLNRNNVWNRTIKTIVRCGKDIKALHAHGFVYTDGKTARYCDCDGQDIRLVRGMKFADEPFDTQQSYIAHYSTKTLSEYLKYKVNRIGVMWNSDTMKIRYYFRVNKRTPEKLEYIERWKETGVI